MGTSDLSLRERLARPLCGEYNSVRYRFMILPWEWFRFGLHRLGGRSWVSFYANRLDVMSQKVMERPLKPEYVAGGVAHFEYLKRHGLKPEHRLLDYGCGVLRTGLPLIRYLGRGNYVGVDISGGRLEKGRRLVAEAGILDDAYTVIQVKDCRLRELEKNRFDCIWAQSVLTHMPVPDIRIMLRAMHRLIAPGGQFLFTFAIAGEARRRNLKDFWYPEPVMRALCEEAGYRFEILPDFEEGGTVMARLTLLAESAEGEGSA